MARTIVIVGFGPGNATAIAEKFGAEGFSVGLVGRDKARLDAGAAALKARGITTSVVQADAADATAIRAAFDKIRAEIGAINVLNWNAAIANVPEAGDILTADPAAARRVFDVAVFGLLAAVNALLPDLKSTKDPAILITNGGLGDPSPEFNDAATRANAAGMGLANAAKHKLSGLLAQRLKGDGIYVGEVMIYGRVRNPSSTANENTIDPVVVANTFWDLYKWRNDEYGRVS
jgi:NAD(P)-dependent dehydrogenase (short-subunit alcohol dehydrogenase family)